MEEKQVLAALAALSQETRLRIVRYLVECGDAGSAADDVGEHVEASSSRASFHLSTLEGAGVISSERQSRKIIYRANLGNLGGVISFLLNDACCDHPDIRACCSIGSKRQC
jgi:ArsR family transcriptional regulator, arsenate/arsenite/antimonite-responsive transcriptional repressor